MLDLNYEVEDEDNKETWPPLILDIYDQDMNFMTESTDYIGRCTVEPEDVVKVEMMEDDKYVEKIHPNVLDQKYLD